MLKTKKESRKRYIDDIPITDVLKYSAMGLVAITGNGHLYGFVLPEHAEQAEAMRMTYDAVPEEEGWTMRSFISSVIRKIKA